MNDKLCKKLRKVLFEKMSGSEELAGRRWAVMRDNGFLGETYNILLCLDPRATYLAAKKTYSRLSDPLQRAKYREEVDNAERKIKDLPGGAGEIHKRNPSRLGRFISMSEDR